jgi:predicted enzyme related to lactoylglutathione lyase
METRLQIPFARMRSVPAVAVFAAVTGCSTAPPPARPVPPPVTERAAPEPLPGKIVWHDLLTHDPAAARDFYGALFGWTFEASPEVPERYWDISHDGKTIGSLFAAARDEVDSPLWLVSVSVPDVDRAAGQTRDLGGSVTVAPSDLPNRGRYAVIEDPQGAFVVLLRGTPGDPPDGGAIAAGDWLWTELWTTDARAAVTFYEDLLGYRSEAVAARLEDLDEEGYGEESASGDLPVVFFALFGGDEPRAGIHQLPGEAPPHWLPYVAVRDVQDMADRATELGARVLLPPEAVRNAEAAILVDPAGAPFGIQQWPRPEGGDR